MLELEPLDGPRSKVDGDNDNLAKSVLDALNKLAYRDDRQVVELHVVRHLSEAQLAPKVSRRRKAA